MKWQKPCVSLISAQPVDWKQQAGSISKIQSSCHEQRWNFIMESHLLTGYFPEVSMSVIQTSSLTVVTTMAAVLLLTA
jgi:hypothetical protein